MHTAQVRQWVVSRTRHFNQTIKPCTLVLRSHNLTQWRVNEIQKLLTHVEGSPGCSAVVDGFPALMQAVLVVHMSEKAASKSPPESAVTAADKATAAALHRVKELATKIFAAAVLAASAVTANRTLGGVGRDDRGASGYAQALQAVLSAAICECMTSMVAECSAEQMVGLMRTPSLHVLKSAIAFVMAPNVEKSDAALHRVKVAVAKASEAVKYAAAREFETKKMG